MRQTQHLRSGQDAVDDGQLFAFVSWDQVGVAHGHVDVGVAHEVLQFDQTDFAGLRQPTCEGVPERMEGDGIETVAVFRGELESFHGEGESSGCLGEGFAGDRGLEKRLARRSLIRREGGDDVRGDANGGALAAFADDVENSGVGVHVLAFELEDFRGSETGAQGKQGHVVELRMGGFQFGKKGFGLVAGQKAQSGVVDLDHFPDAAFGRQGVVAGPEAGGDGPIDGGAHEVEDVVDGRSGEGLARFFPGAVFPFAVSCGRFEQFRFEGGEQAGGNVNDGRCVNFVPQVGGILAVVLVDVFAFAVAPGEVGVYGLADGDFFAFEGIDAGQGELGEEFGSFGSGGLGADALAMSADGFPVPFAFVVGEPEAVDAVEFACLGIVLGGLSPVDALKLCFHVFSGSCITHGAIIMLVHKKGNELNQNLSKGKNPAKNFPFNYVIIRYIFSERLERWDGERARSVPKLRYSMTPAHRKKMSSRIFSSSPLPERTVA